MTSVADNLAYLHTRIKDAKIVAVSKTQDVENIRLALQAGQRVFGENRVQEAAHKFPSLRAEFPDIELHLIGPLQTNKAHAAVELFDVIETLDRPSLAQAVAKAIHKTGRKPQLYIQINIGLEPQKSGIAPKDLDGFFAYCRDECRLDVSGLMCIPPQGQDPQKFFLLMHELAKKLRLEHLSMGMSADYEAALAAGATEVRIGTGIFGKREAL